MEEWEKEKRQKILRLQTAEDVDGEEDGKEYEDDREVAEYVLVE